MVIAVPYSLTKVGWAVIEKTSFELPILKEKCAALAVHISNEKCTALAIFQKRMYNNENFSAFSGKESLNSL